MKYFKALGLLFVAFLVLGMYGTYGTYGNNNDNSNIINDQSVHLAPIQEKNKTNLSSIDSNNTITIDKNKAISIAKLYDDNFDCEFYYYEKMDFNAKLSPDNKYWIIKVTGEKNRPIYSVTVNAKNCASKKTDAKSSWIPLNELKAQYAASIITAYADLGSCYNNSKPVKVSLNGKNVWKVEARKYNFDGGDSVYCIYFNDQNGQIMTTWNDFNKNAGKTGFLTLNEVDNTINKMLNTALPEYKPPKFKDILKDFYPE
ncbi:MULTISPECIES: hypothetical protein [Methanobacterium]|jgi:hypothetical protein|uniref:Uncharacterized protein n=1 Tax=Methanobacterium veterum TaxID=408577 RepID=A0A9E4ZXN0_9EURY|nr:MULTISPECIES: hypothetical protein [Methanobacterium]MCZ3365898.1 hypothetical protein [Methanobacterium veterum]MCZ3371363.1 hypothetical protein [Methanobacterium veterum]